jgi:hypothetical protein
MSFPTLSHRIRRFVGLLTVLIVAASLPVLAQDVTRPSRVEELRGSRDGTDVLLSWDAVTLDAAGNAETVAEYNIYRGTAPDFVPDKAGGSNRIGTALSLTFTDSGAAANPTDYYYLVTAVDTAANESNAKAPLVTSPVLSGFWTNTSIEVSWTDALPAVDVVAYRVYYGTAPGEYEFVDDVGTSTSHSLTGLQTFINWYVAVTVVDTNGNETPFSNEHIDAVRGIVRHRVHDEEELCWGASGCTPTDPDKVQRVDGWQLMVPTRFPEGDWVSVLMSFTMDSRLCDPPAQGTVSRCGDGNPCPEPPCNGGWNPCGDPWDRLAKVFLVLDDCIEGGGSCVTQNNLELMRAVTPYGTDAPPPDGNGRVGPRRLTIDVTPFAPLLTGTGYIGVEIGHYTQMGHWVTVDFTFSEREDQASPKPPADGIEVIGYGNAPLPTKSVTVPATATELKMRVFTTGHGGSLYCDGGTNDANPCTINGSSAECPGGGICHPCDEFCHRTNQILVGGTPIWEVVPWRSDCNASPGCINWNSCETSTCYLSRAGWCPGYVACHGNDPCDQDIDVTADLPPGANYDVGYDVTPRNGSWPVSLVLYWYEP